jgi:hypothetical protein
MRLSTPTRSKKDLAGVAKVSYQVLKNLVD